MITPSSNRFIYTLIWRFQVTIESHYLNRIIEEYQRLREQNGKNHSFCISVYCQKHTSLFAELQASLGEVIAFLGDGTYRKLELVTDQKLTVKEKEKKKKEKEKEEEEKKEEKKEETNE